MVLRRTSTAALCVAGVLVLAACGRSGTDDASSTPTASVPAGKVTGTITVWAQGAEAEKLPALVKGFEKANPGVKVEVTAIPWPNAHSKYQTAIAGGTTPDVAMMGTTWMPDFANAFQAVPSGVDTSDMFAGSKSTNVVKGTTLGVPWYVDSRVIYYRTDLAKKAGYATPPKTFAEFKAMTKAMQTKAGAKWGVNLAPSGADSFQFAMPFAWSAGASLMNADGTKWTLDTPQMAAGLKYYQSFFTDGIADPKVSTAAGGKEAAFVKGTTPVFIDSPAEISAVEAAGGAGFDKKYSIMTIPKDKSSTSFTGGGNLVVFKKSANSGAAWKLVQYLSQPSVQADWYKATGDLPSVQSAWDDPSLTADPKLAVFRKQLADSKAPPANTAWTQVSAAADTQLEKIVNGTDPASALKTLQSDADSIGTGD